MGEIAEMMLDGTLCAFCGSYIDDKEGDGIPRYCSRECATDAGVAPPRQRKVKIAPAATSAKQPKDWPASGGLHMRRRDAAWLFLAAGPNGCPIDNCPTAFERLRRLGFVEPYVSGQDPSEPFSVFAVITEAGAAALAQVEPLL